LSSPAEPIGEIRARAGAFRFDVGRSADVAAAREPRRGREIDPLRVRPIGSDGSRRSLSGDDVPLRGGAREPCVRSLLPCGFESHANYDACVGWAGTCASCAVLLLVYWKNVLSSREEQQK
jgi:hypothetical protein